MIIGTRKTQIAIAIATALSASSAPLALADGRSDRDGRSEGKYLAGDFHNHTTCSDGSISMQKLVKKSTDKTDTPWGLDWFVQAGHGGSGNRNCTLVEDASLATPAYPVVTTTAGAVAGPSTIWGNNIPPVQPKGTAQTNSNMWRWQAIQEYQYPVIEYLAAYQNKPLFLGIESVVAGHEHTSMSVITGQIPAGLVGAGLPTSPGYAAFGNANALAQWAYCFDRGVADLSRGNTTATSGIGNNWDCSVPGSLNSADPSWSTTAFKLNPASGAGVGSKGHVKTVEAVKWMASYHPNGSYYVPAHLERAGPFNPDGNNGFNIEHLRNLNNAGPRVAFGMETQPGHGASSERGEYFPARNNIGGTLVDSVGGTTWGGTGIYGAAVGGVWDALLGEGRNFWFFASSDWHNRGSFGPDDRRSTQDFYPGEYQRNYTLIKASDRRGESSGVPGGVAPQEVVNGLRSGNGYATSGQLIDRLAFVACVGKGDRNGRSAQAVEQLALDAALDREAVAKEGCASMGEKLVVAPGTDVIVAIVVRDPAGKNYSPYSFDNPSLAQIGVRQPLNKPVLDHVDVISGRVTGYKKPGAADYAGEWPRTWLANPSLATVPAAAKNTSAQVVKTFGASTWDSVKRNREVKVMSFRIPAVAASQYVRVRGSNLPANVPFETDASGNPLADIHTNATTTVVASNVLGTLKIPCTARGTNVPDNAVNYTGDSIDGCPKHLPTINGVTYVAYDVAAWADLWFYSNPIYVQVKGSTLVAGVR